MTNLEDFDEKFPRRYWPNDFPGYDEAVKAYILSKLTAQREEIIGIFQGVKPLMERHEQELWDEAINLIKKDEV